MNQLTITESQLEHIIKESILEAFEVLKPENIGDANKALQDLYAKYLSEMKKRPTRKIPYTGAINIGTQWKGMTIYLDVDDSHFKDNSTPRYDGGYVRHNDSVYITVTINHIGMKDYPTFREIMLHEMTHHFDNKRGRLGDEEKGARYLLNYVLDSNTMIGNILYRLWSETERNAYSTKVLYGGPEKYKDYIEVLRKQIDSIESYDKVNDNIIHIWQRVGAKLFADKIKPNTPWQTIRDMFVKKSRWFLQKFEEKCRQRYAQYYNNQEINPDMKALEYRGLHYDDMKKAEEIVWNKVLFGKSFDEFYNSLQQDKIKINKTNAKSIYYKCMQQVLHSLEGDRKDFGEKFQDRINWMKDELSKVKLK